jgi:uncharacterized RDD family membrane protein YckC
MAAQLATHTQTQIPRAGFWVRFDALLIDLILLSVAGGALLGIDPTSLSTPSVVEGVLGVFLLLAYFTYFEGSSSGQTIGKKILDIRVVDARTQGPIGFARALARNAVAYFVSPILLLGYLWMLWDPEQQTWHDKVGSSLVVPTDAYPVEKWPG